MKLQLKQHGLTLVLLGANAFLIGMLALEMQFPSKVEPMGQHAPTEPPETHLPPELDFGLAPLDRYAEIIQRPLFRETRRPPEEPDEPETVQKSGSPGKPPPFVLTGVIIAPDKREALLREARGRGVSRVQQGEEIRGWRLEVVGAETIVLRRADRSQELSLERKSAGAAKATATRRRSTR
jgi:general secretion pathway protein N